MGEPAVNQARRRRRPTKRTTIFVLAALGIVVLGGVVSAWLVGPRYLLVQGGFSAADSRLLTGLLVTGTANDPVIYVTSSDPRQGDVLTGERLPLDTNSGVISKLDRVDGRWVRTDLVRGLPRSEHDHATNGLALDKRTQQLYVAQGGMTNMGAPSARFGNAPEYALSASILTVDLSRLGGSTYDLPTLDDETRPGRQDTGDPFGGARGRNQAMLEPEGPVRLFATGFRNPYDVLLTDSGRVYTIDNSPAWYWGAPPAVRAGDCTNAPREGGWFVSDMLYRVDAGFYGGHPNPTRSSRAVRFNTSSPRSPIDRARPRECRYVRGLGSKALVDFDTSTNGLAEYTASNFGGALRGDIIAASLDQRVYRVDLDVSGRRALETVPLAKIDGFPLDVVAQGDRGVFPGTLWVADWATGNLVVLEPHDREVGQFWSRLTGSAVRRQEVSYVRLGNRFYLAGGGQRHEAYDPTTDTWSDVAPLPESLDHIQAVALDGRIYYTGGLLNFPEPATSAVLIYDPETDTFTRGAPMPRPRGAGGVAVHDGKIYYAGGLSDGKAVRWFDVYDPRANTWSKLRDMPIARDHFHAQVVGSRLYAIAGRDSTIDAVVADNDAYDFERGVWITGLASMPTPRAGYGSAVVGDEIVVLGGEGPERTFGEVEAYDVRTDTWRALDPMPEPRHGIQAVACGGDIFVAAGGEKPYGDAPSNVNSVFATDPSQRCPLVRSTGAPNGSKAPIGFRATTLSPGLANPTSLQFGPDGRLYVAEQGGTINALSIHRTADGGYEVLARERIDEVSRIPNHDDDGTSAVGWDTLARLVAARVGVCCAFPREVTPPVSEAPTVAPSSLRGENLFLQAGCGACHTFAPAGTNALSGPPLDHVRGLSADLLEQMIVDPDATIFPGYPPHRMPPDYGQTLSRQQLADLIAFLRKPRGDG